jgi:predicted metal-binding protein
MLEQQLMELPIVQYEFFETKDLVFSEKVRHICRTECPQYGKSWACPPAVGSVESCKAKCLGYANCLVIGTITEVEDLTDLKACLDTRFDHEALTDEVAELLRQQGVEPYILSTDSCALCDSCAWCEGKPCRLPEKMHPCVESHGINVIPVLEENGLEFIYGEYVITWYSLLFY